MHTSPLANPPLRPDEILTVVLPALLRRDPSRLPAGSVVQMHVPDVMDCSCFYAFSADDVVVTRGVSDSVDLALAFVSEDLAGFVDGTLDMEHAFATRRMKVMGNTELLLPLATALEGGR